MPKFSILINVSGINAPFDGVEGGDEVGGFFTNKIVVAENQKEAEVKALKELKEEDKVKILSNITKERTSKAPEFIVEEVEVVSFFSG